MDSQRSKRSRSRQKVASAAGNVSEHRKRFPDEEENADAQRRRRSAARSLRERAEAQMRYNKADNDHRLMLTDQRCPGPIRTPQKIIDRIIGQSAAAVAASSSSSTDEGQRDLNKQTLSTVGVSITARDKQTPDPRLLLEISAKHTDSRFWWQLHPEQCTCDMPGHMCENCCNDAQSRWLSLAEYESMREGIRMDEDDDQLLRDAIDQSVAESHRCS